MSEPSERTSGWQLFRRVVREQESCWPHFGGILALSVAAAPIALLTPLALKVVLDNYIGGAPLPSGLAWLPGEGEHHALIAAATLILFATFSHQCIAYIRKLLRAWTNESLVLGFRARMFPHVERLSLSYHDEEGPSDSTFRVLFDTAVVPALMLDGLIPFVGSLALLIAMVSVIITTSWQIALVALSIAPLMLLASWPFGRVLRRQWHEIKELDSAALALLQEVFSAVRVVKAFGQEKLETERLIQLAKESMRAKVQVARTQGKFDVIMGTLTALGTLGVFVVGGLQVKNGNLTLGAMAMAAWLLAQVYGPLQLLIGQIASLQSSLASAERAISLLDETPEVIERPDARALDRAQGHVTFRDVSFSYATDRRVLDSVSFDVTPGMRLGIAGRTGAGKTTLMSLLTRLYDPTGGAILLDGVDIRDLLVDDLRQQFSVVLQEPVLFKKSIAENINYALPDATREQTIEAAKLANAHEFIESFPDGYETIVGERGMRVSGGERQRISLARAFLKDAPILVLDEPTSSVDIQTERRILEAMQRLMEGRTTFIIAHRPNTLASCDRVLVLEQGRVVQFEAPGSVSSIEALMSEMAADAPS